MEQNQPRDPHPGASFGVARELISSYLRAVDLDEQISRAVAASQYEAIERARSLAVKSGGYTREFAERSMTAELATTLGIHEAASSAMLHEAESLVHEFPSTLEALADGAISRQHARILLSEAWSLPTELRHTFEAAALPLAREQAVTKFRREARKLREQLCAESIAERMRLERAERRVTIEPGRDGMSWITLYLPSAQAAKIAARLDFMGRHTASPDDPRSRAQRELDIAAELLLHGTVGADAGADGEAGAGHTSPAAKVRPTVFVTVPVLTLLGKSDAPGSLEGFGPIDADTARELAAEAPSLFRILTHPETGTWMSYGREAYKVPADLQRFLRLRDGSCRFPGCTHRAVTGEFDHTVDWQHGGATSVENLASLCIKHHRLKHNSDWQVAQQQEGVVEWTSPAGRKYLTRPDSSFGGVPSDLLKPRATPKPPRPDAAKRARRQPIAHRAQPRQLPPTQLPQAPLPPVPPPPAAPQPALPSQPRRPQPRRPSANRPRTRRPRTPGPSNDDPPF